MSWRRQISCIHKGPIGCELTATASCCSCADKRSVAPAYECYVDGEGMVLCGVRWQSYCGKCKDFWSSNPTMNNLEHFQTPSNYSFTAGSNSVPSSMSERTLPDTISPPTNLRPRELSSPMHTRPTGLQASAWAFPTLRTSSETSSGRITGVQDITNRSNQPRYSRNSEERPRPRMRQPPSAPLGTREDVEQEGYVSPVSLMFGRAYEGYGLAEARRQQNSQNNHHLGYNDENATLNPLRSRAANFTDNSSSQQFPESLNYTMTPQPELADAPWLQNGRAEFERQLEIQRRLEQPRHDDYEQRQVIERLQALRLMRNPLQTNLAVERTFDPSSTPALTIDNQPRPPPTPAEAMVIDMACTICREHPIGVILLPCWHACMCKWCAELCVPTRPGTHFARAPGEFTGKCPKCRKAVRERREIFLG